MRIPLDYYQILAVTESDLSELEQAYQDRLLQLPRQGYSDAAIESRKQLIDNAYQVLSDPLQRAQYETERIASARTETRAAAADGTEPSSAFYRRPELEIAPEQFVGGLSILLELGEYEEINSICMPYLGNNGRNSNSGSLHPHPPVPLTPSGNLLANSVSNIEPATMTRLKRTTTGNCVIPLKPDIILTMIFSFLELGDREWRDCCYEEAAIHFETAQKILIQEDLFPQIQGQIERRLDRLRPYRVSSLVALPVERHEQRRQGIQFLEELLESACTDEVQCQERFGLNSERTIQFIHETLPHLTAAEQRNLFSQVARDAYQLGTNSLNVMQLACTYLHVYALVAQGFAYRNPQLIYTAQQILQHRLSQRLDVTIEQSICALLLGQTEEANQLLTAATESAALVVIRQQSQGYPDLLRGLCWYIESWLKDEVFPCFRDLVDSDPSLNDYFNDPDVQDFAERVLAADSSIAGWAASSPKLIDVPPSGDLSQSGTHDRAQAHQFDAADARLLATASGFRSGNLRAAWQSPDDRLGSGNVSPAMRVEQTLSPSSPDTDLHLEQEDSDTNVIELERERLRRRPSLPNARTIDEEFEPNSMTENCYQTAIMPETASQLVPTRHNRPMGTLRRSRKLRRKPNIPRILLVGTGGVTCLWGAIWLASAAIRGLSNPLLPTPVSNSSPSRSLPSPDLQVVRQSPKPSPKAANGGLTIDVAKQTVQSWLNAKASSMSRSYQTDRLKEILVEPALAIAIDRAQTAKADGVYWQYTHPKVEIEPLTPIAPTANAATIAARVTENGNYFEGGRLKAEQSYSKTLLVKYNLVRQANRWYVKEMDVVKSLGRE